MHGLVSCAEWTGVKLSTVLDETGIDPKARWFIGEGAHEAHVMRSVPLARALDDTIVALYQNGEPLMPGNGYPMRLLLPGYEGNMNIKYLQRIKLLPEPAFSWESQIYSEPLPDGKANQFHFVNEVKSFITKPPPGVGLKDPGLYEISGLAYSGKGRITKVMVSADGGQSWGEGALQEPMLGMAFTRFRMPWRWNGGPAVLQSRAWDDDGNVQPTRAEFVAARGELASVPPLLAFENHHFNAITIGMARFAGLATFPDGSIGQTSFVSISEFVKDSGRIMPVHMSVMFDDGSVLWLTNTNDVKVEGPTSKEPSRL